jgi:hypothetical protein
MFRRLASGLAAAALLASLGVSSVAAGGPPSLSFYVDDVRYRTIATDTDFLDTGAPLSSYDRIYALGSGLINVAESKPGDTDFNGGRWAVYPVTWALGVTPMQATNDAQVLAWEQAGYLAIASEPVKLFTCTVNPVPASW